jgi:hypothetical protein
MITTTYTRPSVRGTTMNVITVRRPELTAEERAKRMEEIKQAAVRLVLETEKAKHKKLKHKI